MNGMESFFAALALGIIFLVLLYISKDITSSIFLALLTIPALFLLIERTSQFLTVDELGIMADTLSRSLHTWNMGPFKISFICMQPFVAVSGLLAPDMGQMVIKGAHWFAGFCVFIWGFASLAESFSDSQNKALFFIICIYTLLLLPSTVLALKIYNYDLLSLAFGALAVIYLLSAIQKQDTRKSALSIVFSTLAAHEKFIATPILLVSIIVHSSLTAQRYQKYRNLLTRIWVGVSQSFGIFVIVGCLIILLGGAAINFNYQGLNFYSIFDPAILIWWPLLKRGVANYHNLFYIITILLFSTYLTTLLFIKMLSVTKFITISNYLFKYIYTLNTIILSLAIILGIYGTYLVHLYWAPFYNPSIGNYIPPDINTINNTIWHFDSANIVTHYMNFILYAYSRYINSIPSIILQSYFTLRITFLKKASMVMEREIILFFMLLTPLLYGLTQIPVSLRYFNLWLFLLVMTMLIDVTSQVQLGRQKKYIFIIILLLIIEIYPFRPLMAPFRPFWHFASSIDNIPRPGRLTSAPWWGWGEEQMLAAKEIEKDAARHNYSENLIIYCNYPGKYLRINDKKITVYCPDWWHEKFPTPEAKYTKNEYFLLSRIGCILEYPPFFPEGIEPLFTIKFRGYIQAWVFRGDLLSAAGFKF